MANRVVHFEIPATDQKRASDFYHKAFGWDMQPQGKEYGGYIVAQSGPPMPSADPKLQGINGGIYQIEKKDVNAYRCVIGVENIKKAIEDVRSAGGIVEEHNMGPDGKDMGEIMDIPNVGKWAKCKDTEGNIFSIMEPAPGDWQG